MANEFSGSTVIDRPIEEVFAFLADGTNDPKFSPRVQEIHKTTDGPVAVGTVFESKVKDAGLTTTPEVRADGVPGAHQNPLVGAIEEHGHHPRRRLRPREGRARPRRRSRFTTPSKGTDSASSSPASR